MSSEFSEKLSRRIFIAAVAFIVLVGTFGYGALSYKRNLPPIPQLRASVQALEDVFDDMMTDDRHNHIQPSRGKGAGITANTVPEDGSLVFMTGFFDEETQIRIVNRDGSVVRKWSLNYLDHFPDASNRTCDIRSNLKVDVHGAHVTPKGEVVFNYEYCGTVKLDQCGKVLWSINGPTHHSLVPSETGGYWILGRDIWIASWDPGRMYPFSTPGTNEPVFEDFLLRVSETGEILDQFSIPKMMLDNGLEPLMTASGDGFLLNALHRQEIVHSNKAAELPASIAAAFPMFEAGDIAISMRELNLVMVIDPVTRKVKWHQTGPWLRQHDPEFRTDGRISIFNNNVYRMAYDEEHTILSTPRITDIMAVDPATGKTEIVYGGRPDQELLSVIRGQHELLDNGGMLITEFDGGRVIEVDGSGATVWEFVNDLNDGFVGEITNSGVLPAGYFSSDWKTCNP